MSSQARLSSGSSSGTLARVGSQDQPLYWTDDLPVCHLSGVGFSTNQIYREDGLRREEHEFEDRSFHFKIENDMFLYGVFDGHDGSKVANFAAQRMPAELLFGQLMGKTTDSEIKEVLHQAFIAVEKGFLESIDEAVAEKYNLMMQLPEGMNLNEACQQYPELIRRLDALEVEISGGTTAVVALVYKDRLYIANIGCCRALLCQTDSDGVLRVTQLTVDHDLTNNEELGRLAALGIDTETVRNAGKLGTHDYTRTIGDHNLKSTYKEIEILSTATADPVIAEPELHGGIDIGQSQGYLILMSDGLYKSVEDAAGPEQINAAITAMVASEFAVQSTLNGVAQAVVDKVVRIHHDTFMTSSDNRKELCQKRDDITLLVRNFNYLLPNAIGSPTAGQLNITGRTVAPTAPLSVIIPSPTTSKPEVNRALFAMNTNTSTLESITRSSNYSTNESSQSSDEFRGHLFNRQSKSKPSLELDKDGRIEPYVDFSGFYKAIEDLSEAQRQSFHAETEPQPTYETIPEEKFKENEFSTELATDIVVDAVADENGNGSDYDELHLTLNDGPASDRNGTSSMSNGTAAKENEK